MWIIIDIIKTEEAELPLFMERRIYYLSWSLGAVIVAEEITSVYWEELNIHKLFSHWGCRQSNGAVRLIKDKVMEYPFCSRKGFSMVCVAPGLKSGGFDFIITTGYGAALIAMGECY